MAHSKGWLRCDRPLFCPRCSFSARSGIVQRFVTLGLFFLAIAWGLKCNMLHGFERESCNILAIVALRKWDTIVITLSQCSRRQWPLTRLNYPSLITDGFRACPADVSPTSG